MVGNRRRADAGRAAPPRAGRRLRGLRPVLLGAAAAALVVSILFTARSTLRPKPPPGLPSYASVAVLPLRNISADPSESEHLAEGLSQTLATKLTQVSGLRVAPWMTSRRYRDSKIPIDRIAREMNVDALVVGTFQRTGERIRGSVALVDAAKGTQVWADEFDEPLQDVFGVQNRIAVGAATRLLGTLTELQADALVTSAGRSVEAYERYLQGEAAMRRGDTTAALGFFEEAVRLDPGLASAYVGMGSAHSDRWFHGWGGRADLAAAEASFRKALYLDAGLVAARRGLIRVHYARGQSERVLEQGKLATASGDESTEALLAKAESYLLGGLIDKSVGLLQAVTVRDPANAGASWMRLVAAAWSNRFPEAIDVGEAHLGKFGDDPEVHLWLGLSYFGIGDTKTAELHMDAALEKAPRETFWYLHAFAAVFFQRTGRPERVEQIILDRLDTLEERLEKHPDNLKLRALLASFYGLLGDRSRHRQEVGRILAEDPSCGEVMDELSIVVGALGDRESFMDLKRRQLAAGFAQNVPVFYRVFAPDDIERWPGYEELMADYAAALARLDVLY